MQVPNSNPAKRPYRKPELVVYGDIREVTRTAGTTAMAGDGGGGSMTKTA
jgi:hypothetical protein